MRKMLMLAGCLMAVAVALSLGPAVASAALTCNVTCPSGATLKCCLSSGSCSSTTNSIDCNGTTMSCAAIDAYNACRSSCIAQRNACGSNVCGGDRACYRDVCMPDYFDCLTSCGGQPATNIGGCP